ncbi:MAG: ExeA family protein [bacterium]
MYLDFYSIREKPFTLSPNPRFLYYSQNHKEALSQIILAVTQQYGYVVLTGDVGTGKTTLINALLECLPKEFAVAKIYHTALSPKGLIQNMCKEFNIAFANNTMAELIFKLQEFLTESYRAGHKSLLILDEAQNLGENILEEIRLLSNFEETEQKFIQILLVGQPELGDKLNSHNLRQLRERINLKYDLSRLDRKETAEYIRTRLHVAGFRNGELFTDGAVAQIQTISDGVPRRINIACDNALLLGYAKNVSRIDAQIVCEASLETSRDREPAASRVHRRMADEVREKVHVESFEEAMLRFLSDRRLLVMRRPSLAGLLFGFFFILTLFAVAFVLAMFISRKLGILN